MAADDGGGGGGGGDCSGAVMHVKKCSMIV